ncbi:TPA: hypothetical protein ACOQ6G_006659 [Bacillus cereus]
MEILYYPIFLGLVIGIGAPPYLAGLVCPEIYIVGEENIIAIWKTSINNN